MTLLQKIVFYVCSTVFVAAAAIGACALTSCAVNKPIIAPHPNEGSCLAERHAAELKCVMEYARDEDIRACQEKVKLEIECVTEAGLARYITSRRGDASTE
jgi:hypothetical protein